MALAGDSDIIVSSKDFRVYIYRYDIAPTPGAPECIDYQFYSWSWVGLILQLLSHRFSIVLFCCKFSSVCLKHLATLYLSIKNQLFLLNYRHPNALCLEFTACIYGIRCRVCVANLNVSALTRHTFFIVTFYLLTVFSLFDNFAVGHCCCFYVVNLFIIGHISKPCRQHHCQPVCLSFCWTFIDPVEKCNINAALTWLLTTSFSVFHHTIATLFCSC